MEQSSDEYTFGREKDFALLFNSLTGISKQVIRSGLKRIDHPSLSEGFSRMNIGKNPILQDLLEYLQLIWSSAYQK